jgi:FG-GAP repeat
MMKKNKFIMLMVLLCLNKIIAAQQNIIVERILPAERLHVEGNIKADTIESSVVKITSGAGTGKILISDAAGNASWQNNTTTTPGNIGFGVWGDCATNGNITEYNPVTDADGNAFDLFGCSVSISGNYAIVGAKDDDPAADLFSKHGSATVYQYNSNRWMPIQKLTDTLAEKFDLFGSAVSISGNYALVGIPGDDTAKGSANMYKKTGTGWVLMQKITAANGDALDNFGISVCISGNYAIVGAYGDKIGANENQGSANIYKYNGNRWILMQKLTDITGDAGDNFGESVSISGNYAIIGAPGDDDGADSNQGSVSFFRYDGINWVLMQKITDITGDALDSFGNSVSISGNYAIVGAYLDNVGTNSFQGSASIYEYKNSNWRLIQKLTEAAGAANDNFGTGVSISGNYAMVGAYPGTIPTANQGFSNIYLRVGNAFGKLQHITDPMGNTADAFGHAVAIDSSTNRFLIGAINYASGSGKVVFGKVN